MRDALQHHCLASPRRCHDQSALPLAHWRDQIDHPRGVIFLVRVEWQFQSQLFFRIERSQIIEIDPVTHSPRVFEIDCLNLQESKIPLTILWRPDFAFDRVTGPQPEAAHLAWRDVNIIRAGQIIRFRRPQEAEPV